MPETIFRLAVGEDLPALSTLIERAYRGPEAAKGWTNETHLLAGPRTKVAEIERLVRDRHSRFVLAESDGVPVGCALIQRVGDGAYFGLFAVDPDRQGAGIGASLLAACEQVARDLWAPRSMSMSVISLRSDLIDWYARRGYRRTGTSEAFPFHPASGALRTDFDLVHLRKQL